MIPTPDQSPSASTAHRRSGRQVYLAFVVGMIFALWTVFSIQSFFFIGQFEAKLFVIPTIVGAVIGGLLARLYLLSREVKAGAVSLETASALTDRLVQSEAVLIDALEAINEGFVLYGADKRLVVGNSKFRDFYAYSEAEAAPGADRTALGRLDIERKVVLVDSVGEDYYVNRRENLGVGPPESFTVRLRDGRVLLISDRKTASGGIVSIQRDVTDLATAEAALNLSEERLRDAIDSISDAFAIYDQNDRLALCNKAYIDLGDLEAEMPALGATFEELLRRGLDTGYFPDAAEDPEAWITKRLRQHQEADGTAYEGRLTTNQWMLQIESDPLKAQEGTGLGLAIVKSLVDLHGGELDIKSEVDTGTTVSVVLPNAAA